MSQANKELSRTIMVDGEHGAEGNGAGSGVIDANNPVLQPPKDPNAKKKSTWKRKLIGSAIILLLVGAGVGALYLLVRAKRVNVTVNAESRRSAQTPKSQSEVPNSDSGLTADAINIARAAAGADANTPPRNSASPVPSPNASPGLTQNHKVDLTGSSPVLEQIGRNGDSDSNSQKNEGGAQGKPDGLSVVEPQSHANPTQSLFVDDVVPGATTSRAVVPAPISRESKSSVPVKIKSATPTVPPFGTLLPVRTQGVIFTLRNNSYARLELTRDMSGNGWSLPKGTVLIGRTTGSEHNRAFVSVVGYIDPRENKLVSVTGDVLGSDGANGIPGKRVVVDRNTLKQTLGKVASSGLQVAGTMAGALTGRGTVVIDGAGYRLIDPITDGARSLATDSKNTFVKVEAGQQAWVMVTDLPGRIEGADAPGIEQSAPLAATTLTDREVMELVLFGTDEEVRTAMQSMTEEQQRLVIKSRSQENGRP